MWFKITAFFVVLSILFLQSLCSITHVTLTAVSIYNNKMWEYNINQTNRISIKATACKELNLDSFNNFIE